MLCGAGKPTLHDVSDQLWIWIGHEEWTERHLVEQPRRSERATTEVDHQCRSFGPPIVVEPEELIERIGAARDAPPPLQVGGFVQPFDGVSAAASMQERRGRCQEVDPSPMFFSKCLHT